MLHVKQRHHKVRSVWRVCLYEKEQSEGTKEKLVEHKDKINENIKQKQENESSR